MVRDVQPELLDGLAPTDPRARRSRRDLQRLNWWMGNAAFLGGALASGWQGPPPDMITELGGGDGTLLVRVLSGMAEWPRRAVPAAVAGPKQGGGRVILVDRYDLVAVETRRRFAGLGWAVKTFAADVFDWLATAPAQQVVVANLFLHHFSAGQLGAMFGAIAQRAELFVAVEPRRSRLAAWFSRCVGMIGCGPVTRYDAPASVRAGFARGELTGLWPVDSDWILSERGAGLFGHLFLARRAVQPLVQSN